MLEHELMWKTAWWCPQFHSWIQTQSDERPILWSKEIMWEKIQEMDCMYPRDQIVFILHYMGSYGKRN